MKILICLPCLTRLGLYPYLRLGQWFAQVGGYWQCIWCQEPLRMERT